MYGTAPNKIGVEGHKYLRSTHVVLELPQAPTIAIVDDNPAIREAFGDLLAASGYNSLHFASAEDFLTWDNRGAIDCILVDVNMTGMSGLDLQDVLNQSPPKPPLVFITSLCDDHTRSQAMIGGAVAFLTKPVQFEKLEIILERILSYNGRAHANR